MRPIALLLVVASLAGCATREIVDPTAAPIRGRVEGADFIPKNAAVQIYRVDDDGLPTPDPFETVSVGRAGQFTTRVLSPGRYLAVYRGFAGPPSVAAATVPDDSSVAMRPVAEKGLVLLRVWTKAGEPTLRCRLVETKPTDGVPDVREFKCGADTPFLVRGMRPGQWTLDLPDLGATTLVDVPGGDDVRELIVDPPPVEAGGSIAGQILRKDGSPAAWLVVAVRPMHVSGESAVRWGRYATTDRAGRYKVVGIPPGEALVRVERREALVRILPAPQIVPIPPAGTFSLGFVVEP